MDTKSLPWHLLESFAAICAHGSLSAAARASGSSQPTLSRHLTQLEQHLGTRLFERAQNRLELTPEGHAIQRQTRQMADAAAALSLAHAHDDALAGTVRLTASQIAATYLLPPMIASLHARAPQLQIDIVATDHSNNLLRREADLALRMYRPTQGDLITRKIAELPLGIFAAKSYVARHGTPKGPEDMHRHTLIGYDRDTRIIDGMRAFGIEADRTLFAIRSDDQVVCWEMLRAGVGIGFAQARMGEDDPTLTRVWPDIDIGTLPVWLTAHQELRMSPRVRMVFDHLADCFAAL
ncbi:LysR family transcriptional regulator [Sulfitobacter albidus]|uniref:LysR family transcriptional regulator n=1 Tax=Sulfitobacter albidus TaxID=2829501 RepID=A0A975JEG1_9RHOB|nr:LysR substrate-binding domain-containing protein [Sulfitobacter albidus]QUJ76996.1 LysR family transcriptional regulator [Sulfitobacter albidus]